MQMNPCFRCIEMVGTITPGQNCCPGRARVGYGQAGIIVLLLVILTSTGQSVAQPHASLKPGSQVVPLNRSVHVELTLMWAGEADVYDIPRPDLSGLPEFELVRMELSASPSVRPSTRMSGNSDRYRSDRRISLIVSDSWPAFSFVS